jgi:DNA repair protein RecO (recombination protein O)
MTGQIRTNGIVLSRVDYGEADRIITFLTDDAGKVTLMAKGVRRAKSKLAGAVELFSVSELVYVQGRGTMGTLISARLTRHYGRIVQDVNRTMLGYELIKLLQKSTEDAAETTYYTLLEHTLAALDVPDVPLTLIRAWFSAQLLRLAGHTPNLTTSVEGEKLLPDERYEFDFEAVAFRNGEEGGFGANEIKFLRLLFAETTPKMLISVEQADRYAEALEPFVTTLRHDYLRV